MDGLNLRLPRSLIPQAILERGPITVDGEYFLAITAGETPNLLLPRPPTGGDRRRFSVKGLFDGYYLASTAKTAICEVSDVQNQELRVDLYAASLRFDGIFDLRLPQLHATLELTGDCFGLANPPDRANRNYVAWQYLAYAIWSADFNGVIWKSERYGGDCICLYREGSDSRLGTPQLIENYINVREWLKRN